jgi:hypothetical protein
MGWWRYRRGAAGLGLFALSLQLLLSFGHIHLDALVSGSSTPQAAAEQARSDAGHDRGHGQVPPGLPDDDCPICQAMHIAAAGLLPAPPAVPVPYQFDRLSPDSALKRVSVQSLRHVLFQTRAPPIV